MIKLKSLILETSDELEFVSPDEASERDIDYYDDLNRIEKESGIRILSDKNLSVIAIKNGKAVGALYTGLSGDEFSFDIIVDKNERGQGIGNKLSNLGFSEYRDLPEGYNLKLDVVNPNMVHYLLKKGLTVVNQIGGHTIMTL